MSILIFILAFFFNKFYFFLRKRTVPNSGPRLDWYTS